MLTVVMPPVVAGLIHSVRLLGSRNGADAATLAAMPLVGAALCIAPLAATAFGIVRRNRFRVSEVPVFIPNLPQDLDGLRIVQITDIHLSPFLSEREFATAIDMANETRAHLATVAAP